MGPIDYTTDAANPAAAFQQGYGVVRGVQEDQRAQQERADAHAGEAAAETRARSMLTSNAGSAQWQRAALEDPRNAKFYQGGLAAAAQREQAQVRNAALGDLFDNPKAGAREYGAAMTRFPDLKEQLGAAWASVSKETQQQRIAVLAPAAAAAQSGDIATAHRLVDRMAKTYAGTPEGEGYAAWANMAKNAPDIFRAKVHLMLAAAPGAREVTEASAQAATERRAEQTQPFELASKAAGVRKAGADATTAEADAATAPDRARLALEKQRADIESTILDGGHKAGMLQIARESNDLKRAELAQSLDAATMKKAEAAAAKIGEGAEAIDAFDSVQAAIDSVKSANAVDSWSGTKLLTQYVPGSDAGILVDRIETLKSRLFLMGAQKMRGMGSLTETEGRKISDAVSVLRASSDPEELQRVLAEVGVIAARGRENAVKKFGLDKTEGGREAAAGASTYGKTRGGTVVTERMVSDVMRATGASRAEVLATLRADDTAPANRRAPAAPAAPADPNAPTYAAP